MLLRGMLDRLTYFIWAGMVVVVIHVHMCLGCPDDAVTHVYGCLSNLVGVDGEITVLAGDDAHDFYKKCLDGSFDVTVHCVQTIMLQCAGTEQEKTLKNTLDPIVMKWAFDTACSKKDQYLETSSCISQYKDRIHKCCKSIQEQFNTAKDEAYTLDKYMELMCSFINGVTGCTEAPIRRYCDPVTAETVVDFLSGITPVTCKPYRNSASHRTKPVPLMITMVLFVGLYNALIGES